MDLWAGNRAGGIQLEPCNLQSEDMEVMASALQPIDCAAG